MINPIRNVLINISRSRFKKRRIKVSEKEAKQHYDLHKSDWEPLCEKD